MQGEEFRTRYMGPRHFRFSHNIYRTKGRDMRRRRRDTEDRKATAYLLKESSSELSSGIS
jgi:hypothetical protein